jgi:hypothetical protein
MGRSYLYNGLKLVCMVKPVKRFCDLFLFEGGLNRR